MAWNATLKSSIGPKTKIYTLFQNSMQNHSLVLELKLLIYWRTAKLEI